MALVPARRVSVSTHRRRAQCVGDAETPSPHSSIGVARRRVTSVAAPKLSTVQPARQVFEGIVMSYYTAQCTTRAATFGTPNTHLFASEEK